MSIKVAIQYYERNFSDRFIEYCKKHQIEYDLVNFNDNDIIQKLEDYDLILWPWCLTEYETMQFAREVIYSLENKGKTVYPNFNSCYFYDNKVGQKYILEAIGIPFVKTNVFYNKTDALEWARKTQFPKVFKLSGGAGAMNVKLCHTSQQAEKLIDTAFGKGFSQVDRLSLFKDSIKKISEKANKENSIKLLKSTARLFVPTAKEKDMSREKGYIYFQQFIPNNTFDIRIIIIGNKAIAAKRLCRKDDFRASGSGKPVFSPDEIDIRCVELSFEAQQKLNTQTLCLDYVFDENNQPLIVEMSYHFSTHFYDPCPGYWDENLNWHNAEINPQFMIMDSLLENIQAS